MGRRRLGEWEKVVFGLGEEPSAGGRFGEREGPAQQEALGGGGFFGRPRAAENEGQDQGSPGRDPEDRERVVPDRIAEPEHRIEPFLHLPELPTRGAKGLPGAGQRYDQLLFSFALCWSWIHWRSF